MDFLPKGRLDAFADGVFAIVITLLVLDLSIPQVFESLTHALFQQWSVFLAYIISFAFVGSVWITHSSVTALMKQETPRSYRLTLLMLFFVSLIPFTTKLMSFYLSHPPMIPDFHGMDLMSAWMTVNTIARSALSAPVTIYGLDLLFTSVTLNAIMKSALRTPGMLSDEAGSNELNALQRRQQYGVIIIVGTLICGFILPVIAVGGYIIVSILFFITPTIHVAKETLKKKS
jgi:uncharacterized membrane protein